MSRNRVRTDERTERVLSVYASFVPFRHARNTVHPREHGHTGTDATTRPRPRAHVRHTRQTVSAVKKKKNVISISVLLTAGKTQQRTRAPNMREECVPLRLGGRARPDTRSRPPSFHVVIFEGLTVSTFLKLRIRMQETDEQRSLWCRWRSEALAVRASVAGPRGSVFRSVGPHLTSSNSICSPKLSGPAPAPVAAPQRRYGLIREVRGRDQMPLFPEVSGRTPGSWTCQERRHGAPRVHKNPQKTAEGSDHVAVIGKNRNKTRDTNAAFRRHASVFSISFWFRYSNYKKQTTNYKLQTANC